MRLVKEEKDKIDSNIEDENINKMVQSFKDDNPNMSEEELEGKIITGVYINKPRKEFVEAIEEISAQHSDVDPDTNINRAYRSE